MTATAKTRIQDLVQTKLAGRKIDVVGFMDSLLELAKQAGVIRCYVVDDGTLRFELSDLDECEVQLDACRGKLRMLCARLSVLSSGTDAGAASPYEGQGSISGTTPAPPGNGEVAARAGPDQWTVRFKNTPGEQEFTITPVKVSSPKPVTT
jgi:hypothetical protein